MFMGKNKYIWIVLWGLGITTARAEISQTDLPSLTVGTIGLETENAADIWGENPNADEVIRQIKDCASLDFNDEERAILKSVLMADVGGIRSLEEKSDEYLSARMSTLMAQGLFREVVWLTDKIPEKQWTKDIKQKRAEALFGEGFVQAACAEDLMTAFGDEEGFVRAVCADMTGVPPASALAYEVYRESGLDTHPFLNAAGEVLYRNLLPTLPEGDLSVWEVPTVIKAYGDEVLNQPLPRRILLTMINNETVPHEIRLKAQKRLKEPSKSEKADGFVLDHLSEWAQLRTKVDRLFPASRRTEKNRVGSD